MKRFCNQVHSLNQEELITLLLTDIQQYNFHANKARMKYRFNFLNSAALLFLLGCILYTIRHYRVLSYEEGWGVVGMVGLAAIGAIALVADVFIQLIIKEREQQLLVSVIALLVFVGAFLFFNSNKNGYNNTSSGSGALYDATTGSGNTAGGYLALGSGTLFDNNKADYNTASGVSAITNNTTGLYNTSTGSNSISANSTGQFNTIDGSDALGFNLTGSYNTAFGARTISNTYQISENTAVGFNALLSTG